jgi:hypothetical protein
MKCFLYIFESDNYRDILNHLSSTNRCNSVSPLLFDIEVFSFTTSFNAVIEDTENDLSSAVTISSIFSCDCNYENMISKCVCIYILIRL